DRSTISRPLCEQTSALPSTGQSPSPRLPSPASIHSLIHSSNRLASRTCIHFLLGASTLPSGSSVLRTRPPAVPAQPDSAATAANRRLLPPARSSRTLGRLRAHQWRPVLPRVSGPAHCSVYRALRHSLAPSARRIPFGDRARTFAPGEISFQGDERCSPPT